VEPQDSTVNSPLKPAQNIIAVYGASGHTGRFVVAELQRRGLPVMAVGRTAASLAVFQQIKTAVAPLDDADVLDRALSSAKIVINCAGPFLDTAKPIIESALRVGAHYLDVTAEQQSARDTLSNFNRAAQDANVILVPAAGFFGGLADLLACAALTGWAKADDVRVGVALDHWHPTIGTRRTGERNNIPRVILSGGQLVPAGNSATPAPWRFPPPFGPQDMASVPLSEIIAFAQNPRIANASSYMNLAPLAGLNDSHTPEPKAVDALGRSSQKFVVEVVVENDGELRRAHVAGQDIYAVTSPIIVEAAERLFNGDVKAGTCGSFCLGELFEPHGYLAALVRHYPSLDYHFSWTETNHD
jgi:NAD(P)-dependent dehydrogenase (short-subunit alcohol dehydrogenase family)